MADTTIQWTNKTWNPVRGCSLVSKGCKSCYAMKTAWRFSGPGQPYEGLVRMGATGPTWTGKVREVPEKLGEPLAWRKPARVFVNSMSDLFHEDVSFSFIDRVFAIMADCPRHTFQVLTKRPRRMAGYFADRSLADVYTEVLAAEADEPLHAPSPHDHLRGILRVTDSWKVRGEYRGSKLDPTLAWPLPNVWLGVSVEDQETADYRVPVLRTIPAAVRFLSVEPLIGPVDLGRWMSGLDVSRDEHGNDLGSASGGSDLDWVIVGGESGPDARRCELRWIRSIVYQCQDSGTPVFVKQLGSRATDEINGVAGKRLKVHPDAAGLISVRLADAHGGDWNEWPDDLRVREFPPMPEPHLIGA